jgi:hypothetical protein
MSHDFGSNQTPGKGDFEQNSKTVQSIGHCNYNNLCTVSSIVITILLCKDIPALPVQDAYHTIFGKAPSSAILTHLKRELIHSVYQLILNSKFKEAYKDGVFVTCYDEIL